MNLWRDLPSGPDPPGQVYAIVEVASGGTNKYEFDIDLGVFRLDRVLYSAIYYPGDYGIIPQTWYIDKDPSDILVITTRPTFTGCVLAARPIGALTMEDEKGEDDKILAVPIGDPRFREVSEVENLVHHLKAKITGFLRKLQASGTEQMGESEAVERLEGSRNNDLHRNQDAS